MRRVAFGLVLLVARAGLAAVYESPINVDDEDDLVAMQDRGEISPETAQTLIDLLSEGVELNAATREELYELPGLSYREVDAIIEFRKLKGRIDDPAELVGANAITGEQLLQIAPFLVIEPPGEKLPIAGSAKLAGRYSFSDASAPPVDLGGGAPTTLGGRAPPLYLGSKLKGPWNLKAGIELVTTRFRPSGASYDATRDALMVTAPVYALYVPKLFLMWKAGDRQLIAGTFRVGFGERLTLDNTRRQSPYGFEVNASALNGQNPELTSPCKYSAGELGATPCPDDGSIPKVTRDYSWREDFRGLAGSVEDIALGEKGPKLSLYGLGSFQTRSAYQYHLVDRRYCADPRDDADSSCASPGVSVRQPDAFQSAPRLAYSTLPSAYHELLFGAHARLAPTPRGYFGLTGYFATNLFSVPEMQLDLQEWARIPWNGPYGAVGLNGKVTLGPVDLFAEVARSFNRIPNEGGGFGAIVRASFSPKGHDLDLSARFYDRGYLNPYARPIAAPDQYEGQRARNEAGARVTYAGKLPADFRVRAWADLWSLPWADDNGAPAGTTSLSTRGAVGWQGFDFFQPSVFVDYRNSDLAHGGRGVCYSGFASSDGGDEVDLTAEPSSVTVDPTTGALPYCTGELVRVTASVRMSFLRDRLQFWVRGQNTWVDSPDYPAGFRIDRRAWVEARGKLFENKLLLRLRTSYQVVDAYGAEGSTDRLWVMAEVAGKPWAFFRPALRYDFLMYTRLPYDVGLDPFDPNDPNAPWRSKVPNPQHTVRLVIDSKF